MHLRIAVWVSSIVSRCLGNAYHSSFSNHVMSFALVFETCLAFLLVYVPGMNTMLGMYGLT